MSIEKALKAKNSGLFIENLQAAFLKRSPEEILDAIQKAPSLKWAAEMEIKKLGLMTWCDEKYVAELISKIHQCIEAEEYRSAGIGCLYLFGIGQSEAAIELSEKAFESIESASDYEFNATSLLSILISSTVEWEGSPSGKFYIKSHYCPEISVRKRLNHMILRTNSTHMSVTDFNVLETSGFFPGCFYVYGQAGVRATDGAPAVAHVSTVRGEIRGDIPYAHVLAPRSVSVHGVRATHLPRKPARHRDLLARAVEQALPPGHSQRDRPQHAGRRQREPRLAHLSGFRVCAHPHRPPTLCRGRVRGGVEADGVCAGLHHHRSVPGIVPVGAIPQEEGRSQTAHPARPARQYPGVHPYLGWQAARRECPRSDDVRGRQLLCDGSGLCRFRPALRAAPDPSLLRHPRQIQSAIPTSLFASNRQEHGPALRSDDPVDGCQNQSGLSGSIAAGEVLRCRTRSVTRFSDLQFRSACAGHCTTVSTSLAGGVVLQVDQAASADQGVFRHIGKRGQNPSVDRHLGLCPSRYHQETPEIRSFALHNSTDFEFDLIR